MLISFVALDMLENLIILKDKFPEFKIYLMLPYAKLNLPDLDEKFDYAIEVKELDVLDSVKKTYYLKPASEETVTKQARN